MDINPQQTTESIKPTPTSIYNDILSKANIPLLLLFLTVYVILYAVLQISQLTFLSLGHFFDFVVAGILIFYYIFLGGLQSINPIHIGKDYLEYLDDPHSLFSMIVFIVIYYALMMFFSIFLNNDDSQSWILSIVSSLAWITLTLILIVDFFKYIMGYPIAKQLEDVIELIMGKEEPVVQQPIVQTHGPMEEVFHVGGNVYTYDDAKAVCSAYGAKLATIDQMSDYYTNGGNFAEYGWTEGQMALFPLQKNIWEKIQANENTKNKFGREGINGGYFDTNLKFGANCFGIKPNGTMKKIESTTPKTMNDVLLDKKIEYYKANAENIKNNIASFNDVKWSQAN